MSDEKKPTRVCDTCVAFNATEGQSRTAAFRRGECRLEPVYQHRKALDWCLKYHPIASAAGAPMRPDAD